MKKKVFLMVGVLFFVAFVMLGYGYFVFKDVLFIGNKFSSGTTINGIDVGGLTKNEAQNVIATQLTDKRNDILINLTYKDKSWIWTGKDFEIDNQIIPYVENVYNYFNSGNLFQKKVKLNKVKGDLQFNIPYNQILVGLDQKIALISQEIDKPSVDAQILFDPKQEQPFTFTDEQKGEIVDQDKLKQDIDIKLRNNLQISVEIPTSIVEPKILKQNLIQSIAKRSTFSTNYQKSSSDRKHNVQRALDAFNGMIVDPGQEVSFNNVTGPRTDKNGYKKANIILNGVYVEGIGGGVCQASTTLYNALILADLEILEVNKHTLPSSYVWLAFDAMVSEGYADLKFKNTTGSPIYIKTYSDNDNVYVDIYGKSFNQGEKLERRVEFLGAIAHPGDRIIKDTTGQYSNKVTYKGEYLRLKYPREGYKAQGYLDRYQNGVLIESVLIRDEVYEAQEGIIIEGVEDVTEGITIPPNNVQFIGPQDESSINANNVNKKISQDNPSKYNP